MEETIKIQEEFEDLIVQLERLKNISELTSANAESAKKVITQIDLFVRSTNEYKKTIEEDISGKSQAIEKLISSLEKSISHIDKETKDLSNCVNSSFIEFGNKIDNNLNDVITVVKNSFVEFNTSIIELKNEFTKDILECEKNVIMKVTQLINSLSDTIEEKDKIINGKLSKRDKEMKTLKTLLIAILGLVVICIVASILVK